MFISWNKDKHLQSQQGDFSLWIFSVENWRLSLVIFLQEKAMAKLLLKYNHNLAVLDAWIYSTYLFCL